MHPKHNFQITLIPAFGMIALTQTALTFAPTQTFADARTVDHGILRSFLLDSGAWINLPAMNSIPGIQKRSVSPQRMPWSSTFLPALFGYAAAPSEGQGPLDVVASLLYWQGRLDIFMRRRFVDLGDFRFSMTETQLDTLAPAEKYDLIAGLMGTEQSLSYQLWQQAGQRDQLDGLVTWTGMCNGWSPAAISAPRPLNRIFVPSSDGRFMVPFYPEDIKSLTSTLFFNTSSIEAEMDPARWGILGKMPMLGKRCNGRLRRDSTGFIIDPECEDVRAGEWHLALVNLIAKQDQPFVADIHGGEAVGNYPLRGYEYSYFNPSTGQEGTLEASRIRRTAFPADVYAARRSLQTETIVGIKMKVIHTGFRYQDHALSDDPSRDSARDFELIYDLELNSAGDIVGGQWRTAQVNDPNPILGIRHNPDHPDFIWYPPRGITNGPNAILPSAGTYNAGRIGFTGEFDEAATGGWNPAEPLPAHWRTAAQRAALVRINVQEGSASRPRPVDQIRPQPLGKIVYTLIEQSRAANPQPLHPGPSPSSTPTAPIIRAQVGLREALFESNPRCDYSIVATATNPVQYAFNYVSDGTPIGFEVRFNFASALRPDGATEISVYRRVIDEGRVRNDLNAQHRVVLGRGQTQTINSDLWYGTGFARMLNPYEITLTNSGQTGLVPAQNLGQNGLPVPRRMACGQIFF